MGPDESRANRVAQALAASEARLRQVLDATRTGTFTWYPAQDRSEPDSRMLELFGLADRSELTLTAAMVMLLHPDDRARYGAAVAASLDPSGPGVLREDIRVLLPDGTTRWLQITAQVEHGADDSPRMVGTATDISDRKAIEQEREALLLREQRAREAAESFIAVMSHELRTPVTSIFATASLLVKQPDRKDQQELFHGLAEDSERLLRIVDDLVVLSGVERGVVRLAIEPMLVQRVIASVIASVRRRYPEVTIDFQDGPPAPPVMADTTALTQVLHNILTNAAKYAGTDGPIGVMCRVLGAVVEVVVSDLGPGPGAEPELLFTLFYRGPETKRLASGTGIGLYVVRELVLAMGGEISAKAGPDGGSTFRFTLPVAIEEEAL